MATRRKQKRKTNPDLSRLENLEPEFLNLTQELPIEEQIPLEQDRDFQNGSTHIYQLWFVVTDYLHIVFFS